MKSRDKKDFYYFDDLNDEIVFLRNDMPSPWMNYLFNGEFFTMVSQSGGNLSWYKSPECWRIGRYNFFNLPVDVQGFFIYVKDLETGKIWNPTIIPSKTKLDKWEGRHGLGYTKFHAEKDGVTLDLTMFVGKDNALVVSSKIKSSKDKKIQVFAAQEMGLMEYLREVQWQCYCKNSNNILYSEKDDALVYEYFIDAQVEPEETPFVAFFADKKCSSYSGCRADFVGYYHDLSDPQAVVDGLLPNTDLKGGEAMFSMSFDIELKANKEEELNVYLAAIKQTENVSEFVERCREEGYAEKSYGHVSSIFASRKAKYRVKVPDLKTARMANVWNPLQELVNFNVSRAISYYATGTARGMGVRDSLQDDIAHMIFDPEEGKERLKLILSYQYKDGHTVHNFHPHSPEKPDTVIRSDDHLWAIYAAKEYLNETGDLSFLDEVLPYYDDGEGSMLEHLEKAIEFTLAHLGRHGIPLMLRSDWNDMLTTVCQEGLGESVMVAEQLVLALNYMIDIYQYIGKDSSSYKKARDNQIKLINTVCYDGKWYIRAFSDENLAIGSKKEPYGKIWNNSQSWAVISGAADKEKAESSISEMMSRLNTGYGLMKLAPALVRNYPSKEHELTFAQPGIGENAGVFNHASSWAIIANCILGRHEEAYALYKDMIPDNIVEKVGMDIYKAEPYIYSSNIRSPFAIHPGEAGVSWLSGTSAWMLIAVSQYIFGVKPRIDGLHIEPCLPNDFKEVEITRTFRGCEYHISYENKNGKGSLVREIYLDGKKIEGNVILSNASKAEVKVILG